MKYQWDQTWNLSPNFGLPNETCSLVPKGADRRRANFHRGGFNDRVTNDDSNTRIARMDRQNLIRATNSFIPLVQILVIYEMG